MSEELWWSRKKIVNKYEKAEFTPFTPDVNRSHFEPYLLWNHAPCSACFRPSKHYTEFHFTFYLCIFCLRYRSVVKGNVTSTLRVSVETLLSGQQTSKQKSM